MTARRHLRQCLSERRAHPRNSLDWQYLTRAARKYVWIIRGVPTTEWSKQ